MRTLFYVIGFIFSYCLKLYPHKIKVFSLTGKKSKSPWHDYVIHELKKKKKKKWYKPMR